MKNNVPDPGVRPQFRSGFTLVELLVVITIVAALAGLSLTVMTNMKQKARQALAVNTIRQVATGNMSYSLENNNDINLLNTPANVPPEKIVSESFWGRLTPFLYSDLSTDDQGLLRTEILQRLEGLFDTNDMTKMRGTFQQGVEIFEDGAGLPVPFAFNEYLRPTNGKAPKANSFRDSSQIFHFGYGSEWADETDAETYEELVTGSDTRSSAIDWFPTKTAAFVFLDGHLELVSPGVPLRRFTDSGGGASP